MMSHAIASLVRRSVPAEDARSRCLDPGNPAESQWRNHPPRRVVRRILFTTTSRKINPLMLGVKGISQNILLFREENYHA